MAAKIDKTDFEYNSQLDAFELYHLVIEDSKRPSHRNGGPVLPALGHALAGSVATATSKLLIYPLDLVIARLQVQKQLRSRAGSSNPDAEYKGLVDAATKIYRHEGGLSAFYTGCLTDVSKGIADSFLFFLAYSFLQQREFRKLPPNSRKQLSVPKEMGIGIAAGAFAKLITTPLQNIITRQQTAALEVAQNTGSDDGLRKGDHLTVADIARQIHKERGLAEFWTGYSLSVILTLNPAITFTVDNFLQKVLRARDAGSHVTFLVAAISKAIATAITYPVSVAKSRAQAKPSDQASDVKTAEKSASKQQHSSVVSKIFRLFAAQYAVVIALRNIYRQDGLGGLYSGIEAEVLKGFISHGLTMVMKDRIHGGIIELYYLILKLTSNWPAEVAAKQEAASELVSDAKERIEKIGSTAVEAGKNVVSGVSERAENIGTTVTDAGKSFARGASQRVDNVGTTAVEAGKSAVAGAPHRASEAVTDASKRADNIGTTAFEAGKNAVADVSQRAENIGVTAAEGGKNVASEISQRADNIAVAAGEASRNASDGIADRSPNFRSETVVAAKETAADLSQRAENIGVTTFEAGKSIAKAARERVGEIRGDVVGAGKGIASEAKERAGNVGVTVVEAGKHVLREIKK